jgi:hypothetical protein
MPVTTAFRSSLIHNPDTLEETAAMIAASISLMKKTGRRLKVSKQSLAEMRGQIMLQRLLMRRITVKNAVTV